MKKDFMENHFNLTPNANNYLERFRMALINFERLVREEQKFRRPVGHRKVKEKADG